MASFRLALSRVILLYKDEGQLMEYMNNWSKEIIYKHFKDKRQDKEIQDLVFSVKLQFK